MTAAIFMLESPPNEENNLDEREKSRNFKKFYEALFIDPNKLTPL